MKFAALCAPPGHRAEPQGGLKGLGPKVRDEPTVAFFFVNFRDHKIQTWYILGSFKAPWALKFLNKVDMFLKRCQYVENILSFWFVPDQYKTQEMWNKAVQRYPWALRYVPDQYKTQEMCNKAVEKSPRMLEHVPDQFVTQQMCNEAVQMVPWVLEFVPDQFVTQEMCNEVVQVYPQLLSLVPDQFVTQEMCTEAVQSDPWTLKHVLDQFVTQEMWNEAVQRYPWMLGHVPDWFVTLQEMWHEDFDDEIITWRDAYEQRKIQKAKIKEELMSVASHPDRWWNWCVPEDEKKELEICCTLCRSGS